jgi:hypothetical protein
VEDVEEGKAAKDVVKEILLQGNKTFFDVASFRM